MMELMSMFSKITAHYSPIVLRLTGNTGNKIGVMQDVVIR